MLKSNAHSIFSTVKEELVLVMGIVIIDLPINSLEDVKTPISFHVLPHPIVVPTDASNVTPAVRCVDPEKDTDTEEDCREVSVEYAGVLPDPNMKTLGHKAVVLSVLNKWFLIIFKPFVTIRFLNTCSDDSLLST